MEQVVKILREMKKEHEIKIWSHDEYCDLVKSLEHPEYVLLNWKDSGYSFRALKYKEFFYLPGYEESANSICSANRPSSS
jgi:hypothetical protein